MARSRKLRIRYFSCAGGVHGFRVVLTASPVWAEVLLAAAEVLCAATGHRLCGSLARSAFEVHRRASQELSIPVDWKTARRVHDFSADVAGHERGWIWDD
jgi:hypothetical protein